MQHFLDIHKSAPEALRQIIDQAMEMKNDRAGQPRAALDRGRPLAGQMVALIFEKPSTRTRISFDVGVRQMGGETMVLSGADMQLGHGETIADTARVLSRYVDLIMIRTFEEATLLEMAEHASVPVINGLTNRTHPCQIMADIMTFEEHRGPIKGKTVAWIGDGNNMCNSYLLAAVQFDFKLHIACPEGYETKPEFLAKAGDRVTLFRDPQEAVKGAHMVSTDVWASMGQEDESAQRLKRFRPYQVNEALLDLAAEDVIFLHCLPAHRGEEISLDLLEDPRSVAWDQAENRLHAQKALLELLIAPVTRP